MKATFVSLLATLTLPSVYALILNTPASRVCSRGQLTVTFEGQEGDQPFSLELVNSELGSAFALANNVNPNAGLLTLTLPAVPAGSTYELEAVSTTNISVVFATTAEFPIEDC